MSGGPPGLHPAPLPHPALLLGCDVLLAYLLRCFLSGCMLCSLIYFHVFGHLLLGHVLFVCVRGKGWSCPSAPTTVFRALWPGDLQFSFIPQVPLAVGLVLCWVLGNGRLGGEAGDPTGRRCHRALRRCHRVTTEAVEVWNRPLTQSGEASWRKWCLC